MTKVLGEDGPHNRRLDELRPGELVATSGGAGEIAFESLLTDWHSAADHEQAGVPYLMLEHAHGSLNATAWHFLHTKERGPVPAAEIQVGEHLLVDNGRGSLEPSMLLRAPAIVLKRGMYAPLTHSGSILVNGVYASSYTLDEWRLYTADCPEVLQRAMSQLGGYSGVHRVTHMLALPIRAAYASRFPDALSWLATDGVPWTPLLLAWLAPRDKAEEGMGPYGEAVGKATIALLKSIL